jgi:hypothetical protein
MWDGVVCIVSRSCRWVLQLVFGAFLFFKVGELIFEQQLLVENIAPCGPF